MEEQLLPCCTLAADGVLTLSGEETQQISHEIRFDGGQLVQFHLGVLSTYSYLLSSCDSGFLIDPGRELGGYEKYINDHHIRLCGVFLTHMHTDFVAGHIEACEKFNVPVFISRNSNAEFHHISIENDVSFTLGRLKLYFFSAEGHSDDCICMSAGADLQNPEVLFTGDALDISPDVNTGMDWVRRLEQYADETRVYTAHERIGSGGSWSTIGEEKKHNYLFNPTSGVQKESRHAPHQESLRKINRSGPPVVDWDNICVPVKPDAVWISPESRVIDIRNARAFAAGHIPYSLNIEANGKLEYWSVLLFDPLEGEIVVIGENEERIAEAAVRLQTVGFTVCGCTFDQWTHSALPVTVSGTIDVQELDALLWSENQPCLLDVRSPEEWNRIRIPNSVNIPLTELDSDSGVLPRDRDIVVVCASGFRSAVASGILERKGFFPVFCLRGGVGAWLEHGKISEKGITKSHTPVPSKCGIKS